MKVNHIGIIVKDINKCKEMYLKMGFRVIVDVVEDTHQNNRIAILTKEDSPNIELVEPMGENSSIYHFPYGYHHICYEGDGEEDIIQHFKDMKVGKIFSIPIVAPALNDKKVVFACLQDGNFIELIL
jgi:catechol 2,3-dioxygenase-like lactoylglutathione lyase family enzyme